MLNVYHRGPHANVIERALFAPLAGLAAIPLYYASFFYELGKCIVGYAYIRIRYRLFGGEDPDAQRRKFVSFIERQRLEVEYEGNQQIGESQ